MKLGYPLLASALLTLIIFFPVANCLTVSDIKIFEQYQVPYEGAFGCKSEAQCLEILNYIFNGDNKAYQTAITKALDNGQAIFFKKGEIVEVTENHILQDLLIKVRPLNTTGEYWTQYTTIAT